MFIRKFVLKGSSQWVIGKQVPRKSDILHIQKNSLKFVMANDVDNSLPLQKEIYWAICHCSLLAKAVVSSLFMPQWKYEKLAFVK